jgi:hypothetical protein
VLPGLAPGFVAPVAFNTVVRFIGVDAASTINAPEPAFAYFAGLILMPRLLHGQHAAGR